MKNIYISLYKLYNIINFITIFVLFTACNISIAQTPGSLDPTFGIGGKVTTNIGTTDDYFYSVTLQPDGKIVAVGSSSTGSNYDVALVRFNTNGSFDNEFGILGKVTTHIVSCNSYGYSIVLQTDGKIIVAGTNGNFLLIRYNANGTLDSTFGTGGIVTTYIGNFDDEGHSVALQSDGKIIVSGFTSNGTNYDFALVRYTSNGSLDNSFGTAGIVTTNIGNYDDQGFSVALQADGKIIVAGSTSNGTNNDFALVRYTTNGLLDNSFGSGGIVITNFGNSNDIGSSMIVQEDGKIIVAGSSNGDFALVRYTTNGLLDNTFGYSGKVTTDFSNYSDYGSSIALQADGKIIVAGYTNNNYSLFDFALVRYNTNGSLDNTFNINGKVTTPIGNYLDYGYSIALQPDGKIIMVGSSFNYYSIYSDFAIVRYNPNGSIDNNFGIAGIVTATIVSFDDECYSVALQQDGKIIAGGYTHNISNNDFVLVRYNTDGSLDNSFGVRGIVMTDFEQSEDKGNSVILQTDGKIIVVGSTENGSNTYFSLARYNINGSLDISFGNNGKVTTDIGIFAAAWSVILQQDGKIIVAGEADNGPNLNFAIARYNVNGGLDYSFGNNGKVITDFGNDDEGFFVLLQPDGKIIAIGLSDNGTNYDFALVRYKMDGSIDNSFGSNGMVTTNMGGHSSFGYSGALQADGKILVAGFLHNSINDDFAVVRYNTNGSLDNTFGNEGIVNTDFENSDDVGISMLRQADSKIIVTGFTSNGTYHDFALAKYTADGLLDNTFGFGGKVITDFENSDDKSYSAALQADGKIIVIGSSNNGSDKDFVLARYFNCIPPFVTTNPIFQIKCIGENIKFTVAAIGDTPFVYQWYRNVTPIPNTNNDTLFINNITLQDTGNYKCIISNCSSDTSSSAHMSIMSPFQQEQICIVLVDSTTGKNLVVWEKTPNVGTDYYKIYRETSVAGIDTLIGIVPYESTSVFTDTDTTVHPQQQSYRYKISVVDTCGNESQKSISHRTLHLQTMFGSPSGVELNWYDSYEGFAFLTYNMYRIYNNGTIEMFHSVAYGTNNSYTDPNPPVGVKKYLVTAVKPNPPCNPSGSKLMGGPYAESLSNVDENVIYIGIEKTQLPNDFKIFPNPVTDELIIEILNPTSLIINSKFEILNIISQTIYSATIDRQKKVDMSHFPKGVYMVKLTNSKYTAVKCFVKK